MRKFEVTLAINIRSSASKQWRAVKSIKGQQIDDPVRKLGKTIMCIIGFDWILCNGILVIINL
jgi:hypothetical protein